MADWDGGQKRKYQLAVGFLAVSTLAMALTIAITQLKTSQTDSSNASDSDVSSPIAQALELNSYGGRPLPTSELGVFNKAAISTDSRTCGHVGVSVLRKNGTAVDAAIATFICNGAVHGHSMGIGGGFLMTIYRKSDNTMYSLTAREWAPLAATQDMFAGKNTASYGPRTVAVPGELMGYFEAKKRFGNPAISFRELVQPTIDLCESGIRVTRSLARAAKLINDRERFDDNIRKTYTNQQTGKPYAEGELLRLPKLSETLRKIGENGTAAYMYDGPLGEAIVKDLKKVGGIITMDDFRAYRAKWEEPVETRLSDGFKVCSSPPPGSGAIVGAILKVMDRYRRSGSLRRDSGLTYHRFIEACKFAYAQRSKLADWTVPEAADSVRQAVDFVGSEAWLNWVYQRLTDDHTFNDTNYYGADYQYVGDDAGTSHISVLAPNGDAVSATSTINTYFGSGVMSPSTGIVLNNEMADFSTPNRSDVYGIAPSAINFIRPKKRPTSSMSPTIIVDNQNRVRLILGASGGPRIISAVAYVAMRNLWMGDDIQTAINEPRIYHQLLPNVANVEIGFRGDVLEFLREKGHKVNLVDVYFAKNYGGARVQGVDVVNSTTIMANNDRRKEGEVSGF